MKEKEFLRVISNSFEEFVKSGTSRSTRKLKPLHGAIAEDIATKLGDEYTVISQGYGDDREADIQGRYIDKMVDITIMKGAKAIAGIGVKFVMQNYSQNSNNYFENMLGETANIRAARCPYFQVFIILDKLPYYDSKKNIKRWETFSDHNVVKYETLSHDDANVFFHTPNKTLLYVVHIPDNEALKTKDEYLHYYRSGKVNVSLSKNADYAFGGSVILNDYETFMKKVFYTVKAL